MAGVSVRTLHYYDQIELLKPSFISENGYRHYGESELMLLQQILFFRELEFPLDKIKEIINNPKFDMLLAMADHKELLKIKKRRIEDLLQTVDKTILKLKKDSPPSLIRADAMEGTGETVEDKELFESFSEEKMEEYKREAEARWGNTEAYKQSQARIKSWTKKDIKKVSKEWADIAKSYADNMDKGFDSSEVQAIVQTHWDQINKFYDCTTEIFCGLGDMYVNDERFARNYNKFHPGLANFVRDAMHYYCEHIHKN